MQAVQTETRPPPANGWTILFVFISAIAAAMLGMIVFPLWGALLSSVLASTGFVEGARLDALLWLATPLTCLTVAFWHGVRVDKRQSLGVITAGWAIPGLLLSAIGLKRGSILWPVLSVPLLALVTLSAYHGRLYAETRKKEHVIWLLALFLLISLVFACESSIFGLISNHLRWGIWNRPL